MSQPPVQAIDWPGIRANAVTLGIRGAARAAAMNLPEDERNRFVNRVLQRAHREGWQDAKAAAMSSVGHHVITSPGGPSKPMSSAVISGSDAMAGQLAEDERETRASLSRSARRLARQSESANITLETPADVLAVAKLYAVTHRIDEKSGSGSAGPTLNVQFLLSEGVRVEKVAGELRED